jgi:hypothetical protein
MALIAYVSAFAVYWWGTPARHSSDERQGETHLPPVRHEHWLTRASIVVLVASLLIAGIWPQAILNAFQGGRP